MEIMAEAPKTHGMGDPMAMGEKTREGVGAPEIEGDLGEDGPLGYPGEETSRLRPRRVALGNTYEKEGTKEK